MLIGYVRVSKSDGSQTLNLQYDGLMVAGVLRENIYEDIISGKKDNRPGLYFDEQIMILPIYLFVFRLPCPTPA